MRICLIVEEAIEADSRAARIASTLVGADHDVVVVAMAAPDHGVKLDRCTVLAPPSPSAAKLTPPPVGAIRRRRAATRLAIDADPAVVHALGTATLKAAARVASATGAALVYDRAPDGGRAPRGRAELRAERNGLRACTAVLAASDRDAAELQERQRLTARPLVVRDLPPLATPSPTHANLRGRLRLGNAPVILVHRVQLREPLMTSVVQALARAPALHLVVLGADRWSDTDRIQLEAERLRCAGRMHLLRSISLSRFPAYAAEADAGLCVSSDGEPTALSALYDYARAGLPVIAPPASEREQLVQRLGFGWIADPSRPEQLAEAFDRVCGQERGTRRFAAAQAGTALDGAAEAEILSGLYQRLGGLDERVLTDEPRSLTHNAGAVARELRRHGLRSPRTFVRRARARRLQSRGEYERAAGRFEQLARDLPRNADAVRQHANSLRAAGRRSEAIDAFRALLADGSGGPDVEAAVALARLGMRRDALEALALLTERARSAAEWSCCAELAAAVDDRVLAGEAIARALAIAQGDAAIRRTEVRVLEAIGEPQRALESARRLGSATTVARLDGFLRIHDPGWMPAGAARTESAAGGDRRVLHLLETSLPHATSGYTYRTQTVLNAQLGAGLRPVAATRLGFPANRGVHDFAPTEVVDGVVHHHFTLPGVRHYTSVPLDQQLQRNVELLSGLIENVRPAVLHAATPHHNGLLGLSLRASYGIPLVYEVRGFPEMTGAVRRDWEQSSLYALRRSAETRCMREADRVVTLSEVMKSRIVSRDVPPERVSVVPHMVDIDAIRPTPRPAGLAERYGVEDRVVVGYVGSLVEYEGLDLLLHAMQQLKMVRPAVVALIVGDGPAAPALREQAAELELDDNVIFTGRVPHSEINDHVSLLDIYVIPRHPFDVCRWVTPLKPYEAMAAGKCLLTSDVEALSDTVADGGGLTFPAGDADALADVISELASDPERRTALGLQGRAKIERDHDRSRLAGVAAAPLLAVSGFTGMVAT